MITFPLSLADFWSKKRFTSLDFTLGENMEVSETGGGEILLARTGPRLWGGHISYPIGTDDDVDDTVALIDLLRQPGGSFLVNDPRRIAPRFDLDGSIQAGADVTVQSVTSARELVLVGLPLNFQLQRGDHISIAYGSNPVRYFLARIVVGGVTTPANSTISVEVQPFIPDGITAGQTVLLRDPFCKAVYVPNSFSGGMRMPVLSGAVTFSWRQTLR